MQYINNDDKDESGNDANTNNNDDEESIDDDKDDGNQRLPHLTVQRYKNRLTSAHFRTYTTRRYRAHLSC